SSRTLTVNEALRKVPGVNVRDEEGFGMRPNIGIRGLNPTRSTKVLLLEDGIPAMYGPYGSNESYYHPPIDRYARIEVLKGVGMLRFGPQTIGGVVNYITPDPPQEAAGYAQLMAGNRDYVNAHLNAGGGGALLDVIRKTGDGARDNTRLRQTDINVKYVADFGDYGALTARLNRLDEDSDVSYTGITDAELANFGAEYNPFGNDEFHTYHYGVSLTHEIGIGDNALLTTNAYHYEFHRDWFRQSSTTSDTQCGNAFRDARFRGDAVDPNSCNSRQGRLRDYYTRGLEPRLTVWHGLFGADNELEAGVRFHAETQERLQVNTASPTGVAGTLAEDNRRTVDAFAAFVQNRATWGAFSVIPALRLESIDYYRRNKQTGREGTMEAHELIPGIGFNYAASPELTFFAGVHEGFAPARAEDVIDNAGGSIDVDAEESTNAELGVRGSLGSMLTYEFAVFRNDFSNQVAVGSIAGGSTPLATGETLYEGAELAAHWERDGTFGWNGTPYANVALTWLPTAEQEAPLRAVVGGAIVGGSAAGKRLPYAPRGLATVRVGYRTGPWDGSVELQAADDQYADFANTELPVANGSGQVGRIAGHAVWNLALNWRPADEGFSAFAAVKNVGDREYIVDRTRGILLGNPLQVVLGLRYDW
ncbi:MAG TPA: TonB-dependent receptor plug domain-containing protein, partial [Xanthomonadales bacterium]|nr:TonB-dependent receptor plug domain-containing protein [Xanthomonadales bacterium]